MYGGLTFCMFSFTFPDYSFGSTNTLSLRIQVPLQSHLCTRLIFHLHEVAFELKESLDLTLLVDMAFASRQQQSAALFGPTIESDKISCESGESDIN